MRFRNIGLNSLAGLDSQWHSHPISTHFLGEYSDNYHSLDYYRHNITACHASLLWVQIMNLLLVFINVASYRTVKMHMLYKRNVRLTRWCESTDQLAHTGTLHAHCAEGIYVTALSRARRRLNSNIHSRTQTCASWSPLLHHLVTTNMWPVITMSTHQTIIIIDGN